MKGPFPCVQCGLWICGEYEQLCRGCGRLRPVHGAPHNAAALDMADTAAQLGTAPPPWSPVATLHTPRPYLGNEADQPATTETACSCICNGACGCPCHDDEPGEPQGDPRAAMCPLAGEQTSGRFDSRGALGRDLGPCAARRVSEVVKQS